MENHLCHAHKYFLKNVLDPINNRPFFLPQGILGGGQRLLGEVYLLLVARQNAVIREHLFRIGERNPEGRYRSLRIFGGLHCLGSVYRGGKCRLIRQEPIRADALKHSGQKLA